MQFRQRRLKSKMLWTAVLSLILFVAKNYFHYEIPEANELVEMVLLILTLVGILNNPTNKNGW
jgi:uncharacterized membrane protein